MIVTRLKYLALIVAFGATILANPAVLAKSEHSQGHKNKPTPSQHSQSNIHSNNSKPITPSHPPNSSQPAASTHGNINHQGSIPSQSNSSSKAPSKNASKNVGAALSRSGNSNPHNKVTLCHRTGSTSHPYVKITVNANGAIHGHAKHTGPIFPATGPNGKWGDIIPPFDYNDHGTIKHSSGQNWNAVGQAIFNNNCKLGGGGVTPPRPIAPPAANIPPVGGRGGAVQGAVTQGGQVLGAAAGQGQAAPQVLPETGSNDSPSAWGTIATLIFLAASLYWREMIAPRLGRS
jgi:hypothetical protein